MEQPWWKYWSREIAISVIGGLVLAGLLYLLNVGGGDVVHPLGDVLANDGRTGFEGVQAATVPDDMEGEGADKTKSHRAAKPTVFCDTHSFYSMKDYIRIENDQFQCKHCGAVGVVINDPADGSMAFKFDPKQTPRKLPDYSGGLK